MSNDLKKKLGSRKFWAALISYLTSVLMAFNLGESTIFQITSLLGGIGALITYMLAETYLDSRNMNGTNSVHPAENTEAPK